MLLFGLDGVSFVKLVVTGLVWISFFIAFFEFVKFRHNLKKALPTFAYIVLMLLLGWNMFNVLRSIVMGDGAITTILGNISAALAILVPFVIIFSFHLGNLKFLHRYFLTVLKLGIIISLLLLALYGADLNSPQLRTLLVLLLPVTFLIPVLLFENKKNMLLTTLGLLLFLYISYLFSNRTNLIRTIMLLGSLAAVYGYYKFKLRWILGFSCLVLLIPLFLLQQSYVTGVSAFETYLDGSSDDDMSIDTRTFLYTELYEDLMVNDKIWIGKGGNGTYYSEYFSYSDAGETELRNNLEVGILGILLKGGLLAVLLNLTILILAIYHAYFRSNNLYTIGLGYVLLIHTFLLFVENYTIYSSYNFFIWLCIGFCLSQKVRSLSNKQMFVLLNPSIQKR